MDISDIPGVGDGAFVIIDKVNSLGGVSFRRAGALVFVITEEQPVALSVARCVASAIPTGEAYSKLVQVPPSNGDFCHVYVVDVKKGRKSTDYNEKKHAGSTVENRNCISRVSHGHR